MSSPWLSYTRRRWPPQPPAKPPCAPPARCSPPNRWACCRPSRCIAPGFPYGSVTPYALSAQGAPLLLLSRLAAHTKNLLADPRASLFVGDRSAAEDPQAGARVSLLGRVVPLPAADEGDARARYLTAWPRAADYLALGDFSFWRLEIEEARLIAGFGEIRWLDGAALR